MASDGITVLKQGGTEWQDGRKLNTGITTFTKTNNIYDLAGNCWEYTQGVNATDRRSARDSCYHNASTVVRRHSYYSTIPSGNMASRPTIYIKLNAE